MCKLFAIVEIESKKNAEMFAKKAIPLITKSDNHGLGIMRLGEKGVHVQRWLEPPTVMRRKESKQLEKYSTALKHQRNEEGNQSKNLYAIGIHGRFATCQRSLENTHPFYKEGSALMHNGIITNADKFKRTLSSCDSEALLSQYLENGVRGDAKRLTESLKDIEGYYASIVFNDNGTIDIWRDSTASLYIAHVRNVGVVIATTQEIIVQAAKKCKAFITGIDEVLPFASIRWTNGVNPRVSFFTRPERQMYLAPDVISGNTLDAFDSSSNKSALEQHGIGFEGIEEKDTPFVWPDEEKLTVEQKLYDEESEKIARQYRREKYMKHGGV